MTSHIDFPRLLLEREHAGEPRAAMQAIYPPHYWPAEWHDDQEHEPTPEEHP